MSVVSYFQDLSEPYGVWQRNEMILTLITPSMSHNWYIMNRSWRSLRLELTITLNLEDLLKPIELDQKT
jgi:hypothetical protein